MKNVLIYTTPNKRFGVEDATLAKIQIDNSLDLGWDREDILLYTNFQYEYNGVKATVVPDIYQHHMVHTANKVPVIAWLIEQGLPDDTYWCHDFDAFQLVKFDFETKFFSLSKYGYKDQWQCGSFFFRPSGLFELWTEEMKIRKRTRPEEKTLRRMVQLEQVVPEELDVSYNLNYKFIHRTYNGPPKVIHFRPNHKEETMSYRGLDIMKGKNKLKKQIITYRLLDIFNKHGVV